MPVLVFRFRSPKQAVNKKGANSKRQRGVTSPNQKMTNLLVTPSETATLPLLEVPFQRKWCENPDRSACLSCHPSCASQAKRAPNKSRPAKWGGGPSPLLGAEVSACSMASKAPDMRWSKAPGTPSCSARRRRKAPSRRRRPRAGPRRSPPPHAPDMGGSCFLGYLDIQTILGKMVLAPKSMGGVPLFLFNYGQFQDVGRPFRCCRDTQKQIHKLGGGGGS